MSETQGKDLFNPAQGKLNSIRECLGQLQSMLPASEEEYVKADSMTHSCVKSCFLMVIQRAINANHRVIEVEGGRPSYHNQLQTFLALQITGAISNETFEFFQAGLELYQKVVNQDSTEVELYRVARGLLRYGGAYINQIEDFFAKSGDRFKPVNAATGRKAGSSGSGTNPAQGEVISSSASVPTGGTPIG